MVVVDDDDDDDGDEKSFRDIGCGVHLLFCTSNGNAGSWYQLYQFGSWRVCASSDNL